MDTKMLSFRDVDEKLITCKNERAETIYTFAMKKYQNAHIKKRLAKVAEVLDTIRDYEDSGEIADSCRQKIAELEERENNIEAEAVEIFWRYKIFIASKYGISRENQLARLENEVKLLQQEIIKIEQNLLPNFNAALLNIDDYTVQINNIHLEISRLNQRKLSLGFFSRKEKRAIDEQISSLRNREANINQDIVRYKDIIFPYMNKKEAEADLEKLKGQCALENAEIEWLKTRMFSENERREEAWDEDTVYEKLLDYAVLFTLMKEASISDELMMDSNVQEYIDEHFILNPFSDTSTDTTVFNRGIYELEKLDYWEQPEDGRNEEELKKDIEEYLFHAELLDDYEIEKEVSPANFDANSVMKKHGEYYEHGMHYEKGDVFDVNNYGKPVSFIIKDSSEKIKMMIMIGRENAFTHWLVEWCSLWCRDNDVPLLKLHVGKPNTEHYIIRRIYEGLGLIKCGYKRTLRNPMTGKMMEYNPLTGKYT